MKSFWFVVSLVVLFGCILQNSMCDGSKKYNRYLAHLFNKYGTGDTMSFEGLEHLMHNLGLGGLEFSPTHTIEQHHPDGYIIPEIIPEDEIQINIKAKETDNISRLERIEIDDSTKILPIQILEEEISDTEIDTDLTTHAGVEPTFRELHDPKHRHPRHHADQNPLSANKCLSPLSLMKLVVDQEDAHNGKYLTSSQQRSKRHTATVTDTTNSKHGDGEEEKYNQLVTSVDITPTTFMKICPALLVQIDQDACAQPLVTPEQHRNTQDYIYAWIYASVAIFIISCCGLIGVAVVPLMKSVAYQEILQFLVAIAIGTLCGDAFMHLLPHALTPAHDSNTSSGHQEHNHNEPVWLCACAFFTSLFMYTLETLLPLIKGSSGHNHSHAHHHTNSSLPEKPKNSIDMEVLPKSENSKEINIMLDEEKIDKKENFLQLTPVAFMVILGDGLHNLTDGLAIGAAFASEPVTGMATALAVLCHELPHELGDFALLLKTGVNINRAIFLNIVSSVLSFMGMAVGLVVAGMHTDMVRYIYAGTAGSFLYIALADLTPELGRDGKHDLKSCLIQILGIFIGGLIMMFIAFNEDSLKSLFE